MKEKTGCITFAFMKRKITLSNIYVRELLLQFGLLILVFVFYTIKHHDHRVTESEIAYFINYVTAAYVISYILLPKFFYKKKFLRFSLYLIIVLSFVIYIEEGIIEKIYFPTTRGKHFQNVIYGLGNCLPIITIITGFKFGWDAFLKQHELDTLKSEVHESELMYLKSQINPHFLFNNLNNLYAYALENSPKTPEIILELSSVLRYILYECKENYVPLTNEINHLNEFIKLSKLQLEERGEVLFSADVKSSSYMIAPLILPVFVENAFKHCTSSLSNNASINIDLNVLEDGKLDFICTNSYSEQSNTQNLSKGIGLENVKRRLELLYPHNYQLNINTKNDNYEVILQLQLKRNY